MLNIKLKNPNLLSYLQSRSLQPAKQVRFKDNVTQKLVP